MTDAEIIEALRGKLDVEGGRHLYGVLGTYPALDLFAAILHQAKMHDGQCFPEPMSVNQGILEAIPDGEFKRLVADEAKRPEPTAAHVAHAFGAFLRTHLTGHGLIVLAHLELLFAYHVELNLLRTIATDDDRVLLLLPGKREAGRVVMFPDLSEGSYVLPTNLVADNHLWQLSQ